MDDIDALVAARRAQKAPPPLEDLDRLVAARRGMKRAKAAYEPNLLRQDEKMEGPAITPLAAKLAATTTPLVREAAMIGGDVLERTLDVPVGPTAQAEFLESESAAIPAAAAEAAARARMAKRDMGGYATGLARGVEAGGEAAFMALPALKGAKSLRALSAMRKAGAPAALVKAAAKASAPEMLLASGAAAGAGLVPGFNENVATIPGDIGAGAARVVGAEKGGPGEAVGRMVGALAPAALPIKFARGAGRAAASGVAEPAGNVVAANLGEVGKAVRAAGGPMRALLDSPSAKHHLASGAAMLGQAGVHPAAATMAEHAGATPEVAELTGALGGLILPLAASVPEMKAAEAGVRGVRKEQVTALRKEKQAERTGRLKNAEEQAADLAKKAEDEAETKALERMYAEEAGEKKAKAGFLGEVAGILPKVAEEKKAQGAERLAEALANTWGEHFAGRGPLPVAPGGPTRLVEHAKPNVSEVVGRRVAAEKELDARGEVLEPQTRKPRGDAEDPLLASERALDEAVAETATERAQRELKRQERLRAMEEGQRPLKAPPPPQSDVVEDPTGGLARERGRFGRDATREEGEIQPTLPVPGEARRGGPAPLAAGDAVEAPEGALVRVGSAFGKVVRQSEDGRTLVVQMPGEDPRPILATEVEDVVWRPEDTPTTAAKAPPREPSAQDEAAVLGRRGSAAAPPPVAPAEGRPPTTKPPAPTAPRAEAPPPPAPEAIPVKYEEIPEAKPVAAPGKKAPKKTGDPAADWWNSLSPQEKVDIGLENGLRKSERLAKGFRNLLPEEREVITGAHDRKMAKEVPFAPKVPPAKETPAATAPERTTADPGGVVLYRGVKKGRDPLSTDGTVGGRFLTPDEGTARAHAGPDGTVGREEVTFQNLLTGDNWHDAQRKMGIKKLLTMPEFVKAAKDAGYDGITFKANGKQEYVDLRGVGPRTGGTGDTPAPADAGPPPPSLKPDVNAPPADAGGTLTAEAPKAAKPDILPPIRDVEIPMDADAKRAHREGLQRIADEYRAMAEKETDPETKKSYLREAATYDRAVARSTVDAEKVVDAPKITDPIRDLLDRYDRGDEDMTVSDIADEIGRLDDDGKAPPEALEALEAYRDAADEDFRELGLRGDADAYEAEFIAALEKIAKPTDTPPPPKSAPAARPAPTQGDRAPTDKAGGTPPNEGHLSWKFSTVEGGLGRLPGGKVTEGRAPTVQDVVDTWNAIRESANLGGSDVRDVIISKNGKPVARISYNGRVWAPGDYSPNAKPLTREQIAEIDNPAERKIGKKGPPPSAAKGRDAIQAKMEDLRKKKGPADDEFRRNKLAALEVFNSERTPEKYDDATREARIRTWMEAHDLRTPEERGMRREALLREIGPLAREYYAAEEGGAEPSAKQEALWRRLEPMLDELRHTESRIPANLSAEKFFDYAVAEAEKAAQRSDRPIVKPRTDEDRPAPAAKKSPPRDRPVVIGGKTVIEYGDQRQPAEWGAMRLSDLIPSHLPEKPTGVDTWVAKKNPEYPEGTQPREYDPTLPEGKENLAKAEGVNKEFNAARVVSDQPIAAEGTPIVFRWKDADGNVRIGDVAGGNGRVIGMLMRAAEKGGLPEARARLLEDAKRFGLDPEAVKALGDDSVPVRIVDMDPTSPQGKEFARLINIPETHAEGPLATAAALNHVIDPDTFKALGGDFDAAMGAATSGHTGKAFRVKLERELKKKVGTQIREYFDENGDLTAKGQDIVRLMMVTKVFPKEVVAEMSPELQRSVANSAVQFARLKDEFPEADLSRQVADAVRYYNTHMRPNRATFDDFFRQGFLLGERPSIDPAAKMLLEFIDANAGKPKVFKQKIATLLETLRQGRKGIFGERSLAEDVASALGVKEEPGARFGGGSTTAGAGLGFVAGLSKDMKMRALRSLGGGAAGFLYPSIDGGSQEPEELAKRRLAYTMLGAALGGGSPGWSHLMRGGRWALAKTIPDRVRKQFRGGVRSSDIWRDMETAEETSKWLAHEVATALPEFTNNPRLERAVVEQMAGEHGFGGKDLAKALEPVVGKKKAAEVVKAVDAYRAHSDRMTNDLLFYKRISPETAEEYRNGWAKRLMLDVIEAKGKPWGPRGTTPRPKIDPHEFRTSDSHGLLLTDLTQKQVDEAFAVSGAQDPWMTPYGTRQRYGGETLLKWEPTDEGRYQKELFLEGLRDVLKADGSAPKGGIDKFLSEDFAPLTAAERDARGEITNPKAVSYVSLAQRGREVAEGKFYYDLDKATDKHGALAMDVDLDARGRPVHRAGDTFSDPKTGQEFTVIPKDRTWGWLSGKALRKEWYDELTQYHKSKDANDAFWDALKSNFKGVKIATPGGFARNFFGNPIMAMWAEGIPKNPAEFRVWAKTMADFARAVGTGDRRIISKYVEEAQLQLHDDEINRTGSPAADDYLDRLAAVGRDAEAFLARRKGERAAEILSLGGLSKGHGKVPGWAVSSAGGAAAGALSGLANDEDMSTVLGRAAYGAAAGAALNRPLRAILKNYNMVDAAWKAAAVQVHKKRGMPLAESRRLIRERMQDYEHPTEFEKTISGGRGGAGGAIATMTLNPFIKWYTQLLRTFKNTAADSPAKALVGLMAVPILEAMAVGGLGLAGYRVFKNDEERRAAEAKYPGGVFVKTPGGSPQAVDLTNIAIMEGLRQDLPAIFHPYGGEAAMGLLGDVIGSPAMVLPDTIRTFTEQNPEDLRGFPLKKPGQTAAGAAVNRALQTFSSPVAPNVGPSVKALEESVTKEFKPGRLKRPSEPLREAARVVTGVPVRPLDFQKERHGLRGRYLSEEAAIRENYSRAKKQARFRTDPKARKELVQRTQQELREARERYRAEKKRVLPQDQK